jgi:hypothetical protein
VITSVAAARAQRPGRSADDQDGPVGKVDHLVCGAAEDKAGQVAAPLLSMFLTKERITAC